MENTQVAVNKGAAAKHDKPGVGAPREAWPGYWAALGERWRSEPELSQARQDELQAWPSKDDVSPRFGKATPALDRGAVEWLLHQAGGPVDPYDSAQRGRQSIDLSGADLSQTDLTGLPLARANLGRAILTGTNLNGAILAGANLEGAILGGANLEGADLVGANLKRAGLGAANLKKADLVGANLNGASLGAANLEGAKLGGANLEEANLVGAHLEGANLQGANLERAHLLNTHLEGAGLGGANLEGANLFEAHLEGATLVGANLEGADLVGAHLDGVNLTKTKLTSSKGYWPTVRDVDWGRVNLSVLVWQGLPRLGDELEADNRQRSGTVRADTYAEAARAYVQVAAVTRDQGLALQSNHFTYRSRIMERKALFWGAGSRPTIKAVTPWGRFSRLWPWLRDRSRWLASLAIGAVAGYGYRPERCVITYVLVILVFAGGFAYLSSEAFPFPAIFTSMYAFHGRGLGPGIMNSGTQDPAYGLGAVESLIGLVLEITFIATFTQRLLRH